MVINKERDDIYINEIKKELEYMNTLKKSGESLFKNINDAK